MLAFIRMLMVLDEKGWAVVLGEHSFTFFSDRAAFNVKYLMVQNKAGNWSFGLGGYSGNPSLLVDDGDDDSRGLLAGIWRRLGRGRLALEFQSGRNLFGFLFMGFDLDLSHGYRFTIGHGFANNRDARRDWILVKVGIPLSRVEEKENEYWFRW